MGVEMRILVAVASPKRGTRFVAEALGDQLVGRGLQVDVCDVTRLNSIDGYDAVIVGAALRRGRWRRDARLFVVSYAGPLSDRPVWLFATRRSRRGEAAGQADVDLSKVVKTIGVHEHRVFDVPSDWSLRRLTKNRRAAPRMGARQVWEQASDWALSIVDMLFMQRELMSGGRAGVVPTLQGDLVPPALRSDGRSG